MPSAEVIKTVFDANAIVITFAVGLLWKYLPALKKLSNDLIPYLGAALYILGKVTTGTAWAAEAPISEQSLGLMTTIGLGGWQAIVASLVYERFGRSLLAKIGLKKPE
jgi:hypothetical protein